MNKYKPTDMRWYEKALFHTIRPLMMIGIAIVGVGGVLHILYQKLTGEE